MLRRNFVFLLIFCYLKKKCFCLEFENKIALKRNVEMRNFVFLFIFCYFSKYIHKQIVTFIYSLSYHYCALFEMLIIYNNVFCNKECQFEPHNTSNNNAATNRSYIQLTANSKKSVDHDFHVLFVITFFSIYRREMIFGVVGFRRFFSIR